MAWLRCLSLATVVAVQQVQLLQALAWEDGAQVYSAECTASAPGSSQPSCSVARGELPLSQAYGTWEDGIEQNGWGRLLIRTSSSEPGIPAFAAGYLEGYLTADRVAQHHSNAVKGGGASPPPVGVPEFLETSDKWWREQVRTSDPQDPYWKAASFISDQLDGLVAGVNAGLAEGHRSFSRSDFFLMNTLWDLDDIKKAVNASHQKDFERMTADALSLYVKLHGHCSSVVKLLPDGSELFAGHNSWMGYYNMLRIWKRYEFGSATPVAMSSYPGMLSSTDDFYQVGHLLVTETTLPNYNNDLYSMIVPQTLPFWIRSMLANRLATSGPEWMDVFQKHNSGTYNNMWMVVDYSKFTPHKPLVAWTLTVGEQLPQYFHYEDQTATLAYGYWPSYNAAKYPETARLIKQDAMEQAKGNKFSYQLVERAQIFRRDEATITSDESMQRVMRYNQFETDPIASGDPCNQLACRADLSPNPTQRKAFGAIDAKYTSWAHNRRGEAVVVSGPTHDDQPAFDWQAVEALAASTPHVGQPSKHDFPWMTMGPDASGTPWPTSPAHRIASASVAVAAAVIALAALSLGLALRLRRSSRRELPLDADYYTKLSASRASTRCPSPGSTIVPSPADSAWSASPDRGVLTIRYD